MGLAVAAPQRLGRAGLLLAGAVLGILAGWQPLAAVALAVGAAYALVVISDLALGVALFLLVSFLEAVTVLQGLSLAKAAGALLFLSWIAFASTRAEPRRFVRDRPGLCAALLCLGTWVAITPLWAESSGVAFSGAQRWLLNLVLFPVVYSAIRSPRQLRIVLGVYVVGALLSAAIGLATGTAAEGADDTARLGGSGVNANDLGQLLIMAVTLATALAGARRLSSAARLLWFGAAAIAALALLATFSRGAIVGMFVALLVAPLLVGPGRRPAALMAIVAALCLGGGYLAFFAPAGDVQRLTQGDSTGSGRTDIWKVGWRMVKANPVLGVGPDNFQVASVQYLLEPGTITRSDFIVDDPKPAHNVYLQVVAETGVVGLLLFLAVLALATTSALQAARRFRAAGDHDSELLARALVIGLCGMLAANVFATALYSKQLWLLLAIAVAMRALAHETPGEQRA